MGLKVIITGSTGMVGKGVLLECLEHPHVSEVLIINRSSIGMQHPKLKELIHKDFYNLQPVQEQLQGYDACFFCLGVSSVGMSEEAYTKPTYDLTLHFAETVINADMTFIYVSGSGTDSTEKGSIMWARVKGKTENALLKMPFKAAYMFRPGVILPVKGVKSKTPLYNFFYVILRPFFPLMSKMNSVTDSAKVGHAMINVALHGSDKVHLENRDINEVGV
jgi:uncharacterized protein YbjT (DUF2867 family)